LLRNYYQIHFGPEAEYIEFILCADGYTGLSGLLSKKKITE